MKLSDYRQITNMYEYLYSKLRHIVIICIKTHNLNKRELKVDRGSGGKTLLLTPVRTSHLL